MITTSLFLTFATSLGGANSLAQANQLEALQNEADEIIERASAEFIYEEAFQLGEAFGVTKQKLFEFYEENELLDSDYLEALRTNLENDNQETEITIAESPLAKYLVAEDRTKTFMSHIDDFNIQSAVSDLSLNSRPWDTTFQFGDAVSTSKYTITPSPSTGSPSTPSSSSSSSSNSSSSSQSSNSAVIVLPIKPYNEDHVATIAGGKLDGVTFVGLMFSRDTCVAFYNKVAGWLNNQVIYSSSPTGGPATMIINALMLSAPAMALATIAKLTEYFTGIWSTWCSYLGGVGGPVGIAIALIIGLVGAACIATLITMLVMGYNGKGFAIGWKVPNIFKWKWYCGEAI